LKEKEEEGTDGEMGKGTREGGNYSRSLIRNQNSKKDGVIWKHVAKGDELYQGKEEQKDTFERPWKTT